jgi:hypothetical protein
MSDIVKAAIILAVAAIVITVFVNGPEQVMCQVRGGLWFEKASICTNT